MDATCKTCPFWEKTNAKRPGSALDVQGLCHHASKDAGSEPSIFAGSWWCSEHPLRQRDRLAAMAMQGILAGLPTPHGQAKLPFGESARSFAAQAYEIADAMLAASAPPSERTADEGGTKNG